jgi:hypothetical protein
LAGFFGVKILTAGRGYVEKTQVSLFRGLGTLLIVQMTEENNKPLAAISSISTSQLPEILFNLVTVQSEAKTPSVAATPIPTPTSAKTISCGNCGTQNDVSAKFCVKCGVPLAVTATPKAGPKFCPKCGDPVTPNEKFCNKCGTSLK